MKKKTNKKVHDSPTKDYAHYIALAIILSWHHKWKKLNTYLCKTK